MLSSRSVVCTSKPAPRPLGLVWRALALAGGLAGTYLFGKCNQPRQSLRGSGLRYVNGLQVRVCEACKPLCDTLRTIR